VLEVAEGEAAKTLDEAGALWRQMLGAGGKRDSRLLAFGGGSVGDLGGFVAGCFLRGIGCAAADDAAGPGRRRDRRQDGRSTCRRRRTASALPPPDRGGRRHAAGSRPRRAQLRRGLVEAIKMAFLLDPPLFARIERELPALLAGEPAALAPVVAGRRGARCAVVERDPRRRASGRCSTSATPSVTRWRRRPATSGLLPRRGGRLGDALRAAPRAAPRAAGGGGRSARGDAARARPAAAAGPRRRTTSRPPRARQEGARGGESNGWVLPADLGRGRWGVLVPAAELAAELGAFLAVRLSAAREPRVRPRPWAIIRAAPDCHLAAGRGELSGGAVA
jgi:hypothetical protein